MDFEGVAVAASGSRAAGHGTRNAVDWGNDQEGNYQGHDLAGGQKNRCLRSCPADNSLVIRRVGGLTVLDPSVAHQG